MEFSKQAEVTTCWDDHHVSVQIGKLQHILKQELKVVTFIASSFPQKNFKTTELALIAREREDRGLIAGS